MSETGCSRSLCERAERVECPVGCRVSGVWCLAAWSSRTSAYPITIQSRSNHETANDRSRSRSDCGWASHTATSATHVGALSGPGTGTLQSFFLPTRCECHNTCISNSIDTTILACASSACALHCTDQPSPSCRLPIAPHAQLQKESQESHALFLG